LRRSSASEPSFCSIEEARALAGPTLLEVERLLAQFIWGRDEESIGSVLGRILNQRGETVAVAESVTGGLVADTLTDSAGASTWFRGGIMAYSLDTKGFSGVRKPAIDRHGVVSEMVALGLAKGVRRKMGADWGIATTGVAGPGTLDGQPVGLACVATASPHGKRVRQISWPGERCQIKERVFNSLLMFFLCALKGLLDQGSAR